MGIELDLAAHDLIGSLGVGLIVFFYFLLQIDRVKSTELMYSLANLVGSLMILYSLYWNFNFASVLIEVFWLLISVIGLVRWHLARRRAA